LGSGRGYGLAVIVTGEAHGMAQQMDNACLDLCLEKGRLDGLRQAVRQGSNGDIFPAIGRYWQIGNWLKTMLVISSFHER